MLEEIRIEFGILITEPNPFECTMVFDEDWAYGIADQPFSHNFPCAFGLPAGAHFHHSCRSLYGLLHILHVVRGIPVAGCKYLLAVLL